MREVRNNLLWLHIFEVELQAPRQHGRGQLLRIGRGQEKHGMGRRLFQSLQQRVEAVVRQHMHFVNQIDLVARSRRGVLHVLKQFPRIFNFGLRCRIHLDQVD